MKQTINRWQFLSAGVGVAALAIPRAARARRFAQRYQFASAQWSVAAAGADRIPV